MGERLTQFQIGFNKSIRVEARAERITSDAGAILTREALDGLGVLKFFAERLEDGRDQRLITHPLQEMVATLLLLMCQGWRDQDDADLLRDDGAMRLCVSERKGVAALATRPAEQRARDKNPQQPDGLASQPTLSRTVRMLSTQPNQQVLRQGLLMMAGKRIRKERGGHRVRYLTLDVDSLPIKVEGHQPGTQYNGHYHARIYHPLVASVAETGDILDARLRAGNAHTAQGSLDFILELVDQVEQQLCQVASVRMDAGFPSEPLLSGLETRSIPYVARVKNNPVLDRMAAPYLFQPAASSTADSQDTWFYEMSYQAESWSRPRRVVLVTQKRDDELLLHHFWLITDLAPEQMPADALLALYRDRGTAEGHMGELMNVLAPALSSSPRPKSHYRQQTPTLRTPSGDSFAQNEVLLLLNLLAYQTLHTLRLCMERASGVGWSIKRLRERVLRVAAHILVHARSVVFVLEQRAIHGWVSLQQRLRLLLGPAPAS